MITNREEVLANALRVFAKMNYEKASLTEIAKACGLSKAGLIYYYPFKLDLFIAVIDKYVFSMLSTANKFRFTYTSLSEFIDKYVEGIKRTMHILVSVLKDDDRQPGCSPNFYYYNLLMQVRQYYPDVEKKIESLFNQDYTVWESAIQLAKDSGEIRHDLNTKDSAFLFRQAFFGLAYEQSFLSGLDTKMLVQKFRFIYSLLKS